MLTSKDFWVSALERALVTFASALIAAIGTTQVGILDVNWEQSLSLAGTAAVLSILTSIVSGGTSKTNSVALFGVERLEVPKKKTAEK
jgi:hypothetical protein